MDIIDTALKDRNSADEILKYNPFLWNLFKETDAKMVSDNRKIIENKFSLSGYGKRLYEIYEKMA